MTEQIDVLLFVQLLRSAFVAELETTGQYNKAGMQMAFERAVSTVLMKLLEQSLTKEGGDGVHQAPQR